VIYPSYKLFLGTRFSLCLHQHNLISYNILVRKGINLIALQEPAISSAGLTIASRDWTAVYPSNHSNNLLSTRSITLIRVDLSTKSWNQIDFPSSNVIVTQLSSQWGKVTIFKIYNDGNSDETLKQLAEFHRRNQDILEHAEEGKAHIVWLGDFNRHHPYWDNPEDTRLFMNEAIEATEKLIEILADTGLELALPSRILTVTARMATPTKADSKLSDVHLESLRR
jgi:hypothetical protein